MAATTINFDGYSDALVLLGTAGVVVPIVQRFRVSPVLVYLAAGLLLGPLGLGQFKETVPLFYWITVSDAANVRVLAELGVVFLLFLVGLELSYVRLVTLRRQVFGLGLSQVVLCALAIGAVAAGVSGLRAGPAVVVGCCLALSSTAMVIENLSHHQRMTTSAGRSTFAILFAQDLAVVPILLFVSILGAHAASSVAR